MQNNDDEWVPVGGTELKRTTLDKLIRGIWGLGFVLLAGAVCAWAGFLGGGQEVIISEVTRVIVETELITEEIEVEVTRVQNNLVAVTRIVQVTPTPLPTEEPVRDELIAHYLLDGNGRDVTGRADEALIFEALPTAGRSGWPNSAYAFDGVDDYVSVGNKLINDDAFSVSVWVNTRTEKYLQRIMTNYRPCSGSGNGFGFNYWGADSEYGTSLRVGNTEEALQYDINLSDGRWHHLVVTYELANFALYVDGEFVSQLPSTYNRTHIPLDFGRANAARPDCGDHENSHFNGRMDDIRIFNYALPPSEVRSLYEAPEDLGLTTDYVPINESTARVTKGVVPTADHLGRADAAYQFDGESAYLQFRELPQTETIFSLSLWFKVDEDKNNQFLIGNYRPCSYLQAGFYLAYYGTDNPVGPHLDLTNSLRDGGVRLQGNLGDGQWHHVVIVFEEKAYSLYVDGVLVGTQPGNYIPTDVHMDIGRGDAINNCSAADNPHLLGAISDIRFYEEALDIAGVQTIYGK